ncbi:NAD-dependent epimerase/dehydratase family protein [Actinokineospora sp. UTMC 2448]|uniref:NAD-dependent epimerase/dehydratase family protein n=1 Tax=Actinokineospora sp. UTMC 2448 TaxID=2268449 RepID=UPI002164222F|nr:NAD-dependent epimerase/dehydratase family protein [Actinokineospora sp. UTMC 2448]UVS80678.1 UDP-galactose-4-epimerase [Actinokineospora sp. UTMC 2448]
MRIVVVGGTGSIGTALLDVAAVRGHKLVGVSRREPAPGPPYADVEWHPIDIAERTAFTRLVEAFDGADAVVHAAWLIQPSRERAHLHKVNVEGTGVLLDAVAVAGVPHVVYLSSVGAYAPKDRGGPVTESWPTTGIDTSDYSRDKAEVEAMLDRFEAARPGIAVTRLRPALVLQRRSAAELRRYFTGRLVPRALWKLVRSGRLPALPLPSGLALQFVHAADVATAALAAIDRQYRGAVNLAADPIMDSGALAAAVGARPLTVPPSAVRALMAGAWRARLLPMPASWLDLAMGAPTMSADLARAELDWSPRWNATETLGDLLAGLAEGEGVPASPPLRPSP